MSSLIKSLVFLVAIIAIIVYAIVRIVLTMALAHNYGPWDRVFSFTLLAGELFILFHAAGYAIDLVRAFRAKDIKDRPTLPIPFPPPDIAILVAARHEPRHVIEDTFRSLVNLRYASKTIYFLDDSSEDSFKREAEEIVAKYNLRLFRREVRHGAKAGIINDCLKTLTEKYVAVFDADMQPMPGFLNSLIPLLEADPKVGFIQTPQFYSNIDESRVAHGAAFQQAVFYEYICEAKGSSAAMFCCGTNVVFRREALLSVGGMIESNVTEDFATSVNIHCAGWKSLYYNHVGAFGMGPETLAAYFTQQARWSKGTTGVLLQVLKNFIRKPFSLSPVQWWEYFLSCTYYFIGYAFLLLMLCPIAYLLFNIPSFFIHTDIYISVFVPYFSLSLGVFFVSLGARHYKPRDLFIGQMLTYITFPVFIVSVTRGLLGMQGTFGVTKKGGGKHLPYRYLWPQLSFLFLNFIAITWGINRFYYERQAAILINSVWALYHFIIMCSIFYFNEAPTKKEKA